MRAQPTHRPAPAPQRGPQHRDPPLTRAAIAAAALAGAAVALAFSGRGQPQVAKLDADGDRPAEPTPPLGAPAESVFTPSI